MAEQSFALEVSRMTATTTTKGTTSIATLQLKVAAAPTPAPVIVGEVGNPCYQKNVCFNEHMPLLNQRGAWVPANLVPDGDRSRSMLCGPTSGLMVLKSLKNAEFNALPGSEIQREFMGRTNADQLAYVTRKMGTSVKNGTWFLPSLLPSYLQSILSTIAEWVAGGRADLVVPGVKNQIARTDGYVSGYNPPMNNFTLIDKIKNTSTFRGSSMLSYGHFTRYTTTVLGLTSYRYGRDGGHFVAVNGYDAYNRLLIYNPSDATADFRDIKPLDLTTKWGKTWGIPYVSEIHINIYNPFASSVPFLLSEGNKYKIIDGYMGMYSYK